VGDRREETTKRHRIGLERASQIWIKQSTNVKREATIMNFTARRHASAVNEVSATDVGRKLGGGAVPLTCSKHVPLSKRVELS